MDTSSEALSSNIAKGEKLNKCKLCDFASGQARNLRTHMKKHNEEKLVYILNLNIIKLPLGFEPRSVDSKSTVITARLWKLDYIIL